MTEVIVAMTGASGALYTLKLIEQLVLANKKVIFLCSDAGKIVLATESNISLPKANKKIEELLTLRFNAQPNQIKSYALNDWNAPIASGTSTTKAMIVVPCTTGALSAIATAQSNNLIERAADVMLKERRKLILLIRETPFNAIHLQHMLTLNQAGAIIMPANPGFYHNPKTIDDLANYIVCRALDHLEIPNQLMQRW